jgi:hypothetical protein
MTMWRKLALIALFIVWVLVVTVFVLLWVQYLHGWIARVPKGVWEMWVLKYVVARLVLLCAPFAAGYLAAKALQRLPPSRFGGWVDLVLGGVAGVIAAVLVTYLVFVLLLAYGQPILLEPADEGGISPLARQLAYVGWSVLSGALGGLLARSFQDRLPRYAT